MRKRKTFNYGYSVTCVFTCYHILLLSNCLCQLVNTHYHYYWLFIISLILFFSIDCTKKRPMDNDKIFYTCVSLLCFPTRYLYYIIHRIALLYYFLHTTSIYCAILLPQHITHCVYCVLMWVYCWWLHVLHFIIYANAVPMSETL